MYEDNIEHGVRAANLLLPTVSFPRHAVKPLRDYLVPTPVRGYVQAKENNERWRQKQAEKRLTEAKTERNENIIKTDYSIKYREDVDRLTNELKKLDEKYQMCIRGFKIASNDEEKAKLEYNKYRTNFMQTYNKMISGTNNKKQQDANLAYYNEGIKRIQQLQDMWNLRKEKLEKERSAMIYTKDERDRKKRELESTQKLLISVIKHSDIIADDFIAHYGTPRHSGRYPFGSGMRPFQSDPARARRSKHFFKLRKKKSLKEIKADHEEEVRKTIAKKKISELTDEELRAKINRLQMEKQLRQLLAEQTPKREAKAMNFLKSFCDSSAKIVKATYEDIGKQYLKYGVGNAINNASGTQVINVKSSSTLDDFLKNK